MSPPEPPASFVTPVLPERFLLVEDDAWLGPLDRSAFYHEPDGAVVYYEDGSLPMRIGVVRQDGDVLHLFPEGQTRIITIPSRYLDLDLPARFQLDVSDGADWVEVGALEARMFGRLDDGAYVCSGWGGSPLFLRCIDVRGDALWCLDGGGSPVRYRTVPLP